MQSNSSPEIKSTNRLSPTSSGRILYHVSCKVCHDHSSGKHYGIYACDGCAGFFKRSIRRNRQYVCKSQKPGLCIVDKTHRNQCRSCRLQRCIDVGMNKDAVQHERGPRNSTLRRNLSIYKDNFLGDMSPMQSDVMINSTMLSSPLGFSSAILDLSVQRFAATHNMYSPGYINLMASRVLPPTPPLLAVEHIKEMAAEQLFKHVKWIKNSFKYKNISISDQLAIVENSWKNLFIISMAQHLPNINISHVVYAYESESSNKNHIKIISEEIVNFQDIVNQFMLLGIDVNECELLKNIILYDCPYKNLEHADIINAYHEDSKKKLSNYIKTNYSTNHKHDNIMNIITKMNQISSFTVEEIFFRKTIGDITISRLISDMFLKNIV